MNWKKTRLSISRWETTGFRITETTELDGRPFTMEYLNEEGQEPMAFSTLKEAQDSAQLHNELFLAREEVQRLRTELNERKQAEAYGRREERLPLPEDFPEDDGRGVPASKPLPVAMEDGLDKMIADRAAKEKGDCNCAADIPSGPRLAYAGENEYPF